MTEYASDLWDFKDLLRAVADSKRQRAAKERLKIQLRCEAYNIFNHVSYDTVQNTATFNATTGQLTSNGNFGALTGDRDPRILQLVAKISF